MSLINDALKRAKEAQRPDKPSSVSSLRTIETRPPARPFISRMLVVVIFTLLAATFTFVGLSMTGRLGKKNIAAPPVALAQPVQPAVAPVPPVPAAPPVVPVVVAAPAKPTPAPVAVVAPPLPPLELPDTLHVQGVAYDPVRPWAIISGRTFYVGDLVKGVRVMAITRDSVTFGSHGQTNLLFVGQ
jgi:hypothetical protein